MPQLEKGRQLEPNRTARNADDGEFSRDLTDLPSATATQVIDLADGDTYHLKAAPVRKQIGSAEVRLLAYNGSVPGPTLRVRQGSSVTVSFTNQGDLESTVHWHGLRLENRYDGTHETQMPVRSVGASSTASSSPTLASTGTTRTFARTTARNWDCTATCWWSPPSRITGRRSTERSS